MDKTVTDQWADVICGGNTTNYKYSKDTKTI